MKVVQQAGYQHFKCEYEKGNRLKIHIIQRFPKRTHITFERQIVCQTRALAHVAREIIKNWMKN